MLGISCFRRYERSWELWRKQTSLKSKTEAKRFLFLFLFFLAEILWFKGDLRSFSVLKTPGTDSEWLSPAKKW